jgi:SAM-dependent methyltransferase
VSDQSAWDERYRASPAVWSGDPNPQLVEEISGLVPGRALDAGCGEGADAIWLAKRGWHVTAVDISAVALEHARAIALSAETARRIEWRHADLSVDVPAPAAYDLVSAHFVHLPPVQREALFHGLATAVKPGGALLIVGHDPSDLRTSARRPSRAGVLFTAAEVASLLDPASWNILVEAARPRSTTDPAGQIITVHDAVLRAHRHA